MSGLRSRVLAIDPGSAQSGWALVNPDGTPAASGVLPNGDVLELLATPAWGAVAIECIEPRYGLQAGWEVLDTARWLGRFEQAASESGCRVALLQRSSVLRHLGVATSRRKGEPKVSADAGVRAALLDRHGGRDAAIGRKAAPGPLHGVSSHAWAALAVGVTWLDRPELAR